VRFLRALERGDLTDIGQTPWARAMDRELPDFTPPPRGLDPGDAARLRGRVDELYPEIPDLSAAQLDDIAGPRLPTPRAPGSVELDPVIRALADIEAGHRTPTGAITPGRMANVAEAERMRESFEATGGRLPFGGPATQGRTATGFHDALRAIDEDINYTPGSNAARNFPDAAEAELRTVRHALRQAGDTAVERALGPEVGAGYRNDRRDYQVAGAISGMGEDEALRDVANRQLSMSDYQVPRANAGWLERLGTMLANRAFRGREHTGRAVLSEAASDFLGALDRNQGSLRGGVEGAGRAGLAGALGPDAEPQVLEEGGAMSDDEIMVLPELSDDALTDDEIMALPVIE
jgi:hypothetical protein